MHLPDSFFFILVSWRIKVKVGIPDNSLNLRLNQPHKVGKVDFEPLQFVFDAIMPHRPYKYAWTLQEAMDFLQSENGEHSRPDRVRAFEPRIDAAAAILRELGNAPD